jgi:hypothetical protein
MVLSRLEAITVGTVQSAFSLVRWSLFNYLAYQPDPCRQLRFELLGLLS